MRTVPAAFTTARLSASSRLCKIWRIERTDGTVLRFTEHDRDLTVDGETFLATASFDPSAIKASADMSVDDLEVIGAFDSAYIESADLLAGRFNGASFYVAEVIWDNLAEGKDVLRFGRMGNIRESGGKFSAELLGPTWRLQNPIGDLYSATCRATLGDAMCKVDLAPWTFSGEVASVDGRNKFTVARLGPPWDYFAADDEAMFQFGLLTWDSGSNDGLSMEIYQVNSGGWELLFSMPFDIAVGDTFTVIAGCPKSLETCRSRFDNVLNFQGEPHVPVSDDLIKGPVRGGIESEPATVPDDDDGSGYPLPDADPGTVVMSGSPSMTSA